MIESHHKKANIEKKLAMERIPGKIKELKEEQKMEGEVLQKKSFSNFIGIITIM